MPPFQDVLQQLIVMDLPNALAIVHEPDKGMYVITLFFSETISLPVCGYMTYKSQGTNPKTLKFAFTNFETVDTTLISWMYKISTLTLVRLQIIRYGKVISNSSSNFIAYAKN